MAVMQMLGVVKVHVKDVALIFFRLPTLEVVLKVRDLFVSQPLETSDRQLLLHCPAIEVVGVEVCDEGRWFFRVVPFDVWVVSPSVSEIIVSEFAHNLGNICNILSRHGGHIPTTDSDRTIRWFS